MRITAKGILMASSAVSLIAVAMCVLWHFSPRSGLPLTVHPLDGRSQWTSFGGRWIFSEVAIQNASDERGAKLVRGSQYWRDYVVDSDVQLEGDNGDVGLLLRVQEPDEGVDAFRGMYAGLRIPDNSLFAGEADYGWNEFQPKHITTTLQPYTWYHLQAAVHACELSVVASTIDGVILAATKYTSTQCSDRGQFGLRSYRVGGSWRAIRVTALSYNAESER